MRPSSPYLNEMLNKMPSCELNLSGSTPPFSGGKDFFSDVKLIFEPSEVMAKRKELVFELARRQKAGPGEISFSVGSSQVYTQALAAISDAGDTIFIESPTYDPFFKSAEFLGLKVKFFSRSCDFDSDYSALKKQLRGKKAKVIVISNPNCPTGQLYAREQMKKLAGLTSALLVDEVFLPLFSDGAMSWLDGDRPKNILTIGSFSKSLGLSVLRLGWLRADTKIIKKFDNIGLNLHIEMPAFSIVAALKAAQHWEALLAPNLAIAEKNRRGVRKIASENGVLLSHDFTRGYFGTMKVPKPYRNGDDYAAHILKTKGVWLRPTRLFRLPDAVRFHILASSEQLKRYQLPFWGEA